MYENKTAIEIMNELAMLPVNGRYVFRGYKKEQELLPVLFRDDDLTGSEFDLLKDFEKYGQQHFYANNIIDFVSYAQHFGLPTRLLDYTYNPFVALLFSLYRPQENDGEDYYYINMVDLDKNVLFESLPYSEKLSLDGANKNNTCLNDDYYLEKTLTKGAIFKTKSYISEYVSSIIALNEFIENVKTNNIDARKYLEVIYWDMKPKDYGKPTYGKPEFINDTIEKLNNRNALLFVAANEANPRISMQQGLFLFPYKLDKESYTQNIMDNSQTIKISRDVRVELLGFLEKQGYTMYRLMPDLASICSTIKNNYL